MHSTSRLHSGTKRFLTFRKKREQTGGIRMKYLLSTTMLAAALFSTAALADELTVVSWGGAYSASQKSAYIDPYNKMGNKITETEYNGEVAKIKAMVEAKSITWDVIDADVITTWPSAKS